MDITFIMRYFWMITLTFSMFEANVQCQTNDRRAFPDGFLLGAASASYQVEGAWNVNGKGESHWDFITHNQSERISDRSNGDIACDSFNKYKEDVQWIKSIGLDHYRFSLSWTRILPSGFNDTTNPNGIRYYRDLLEELKVINVTTVVTLYHRDHPQALENLGGWRNERMVQWFEDYAKVVFDNLGHLVDIFIPINEINALCADELNDTYKPRGNGLDDMGEYACIHNGLKAHAKVWHLYDKNYRATQGGMIGFVSSSRGWVPSEGVTEESIDRYFQFRCGIVMHPIFIGDYPEILKTRIGNISNLENLPESRLPEFTDEWKNIIKGATDFLGLNHYTSRLPIFDTSEKLGVPTSDSGIIEAVDPNWSTASSQWLTIVPEGIGNVLRKIRDEYDNPALYIFENGFSDTGETEDYARIKYHYDYASEVLKATVRDGCNVKAYTVWSLLDNFEWYYGYTQRFGILKVDFDSPNRTRSEKLSTQWLREVIRTRTLIEPPAPSGTRSGSCEFIHEETEKLVEKL
ncbi:myrosinase 1-like [Athalia rosae]|uniref:myrosinase 1-like n=1 Tax=Athalia rosae TaxID=37344 RepID=UPI002034A432|nr:myrosinase 1-like [Athalia rosae]